MNERVLLQFIADALSSLIDALGGWGSVIMIVELGIIAVLLLFIFAAISTR